MPDQYQPLFLKYRPQAISELVGQDSVCATLANAIKYDRISHAYLFTGPRGTGKTSAARIFAKSLNCELGPTAEPCQKCTSCLEIKQGISPSVFEIDAASNNSVDDARLLIERAPLSACGGRFKLYIIDECHMLTKEAFNALLKTIEEPPANVIFILATTEEHKVLPTIVSRCQKLIFRLINEKAMTAHLSEIAVKENILIDSPALTALARRANGGLRDALSLLDQISLLGVDGEDISTDDILLLTGALPEDILIAISDHIFKREGQQVLILLQELFASGREAHLIASELAKHMLNIAKAAYEDQSAANKKPVDYLAGSEKYKKAIVAQAKLVESAELIQMIEEMDRLEVSCRRSAQPIMNLEIGLLSLCQRLDIAQLKSMQSRLQKLENALASSAGKEILLSVENMSAKVLDLESKQLQKNYVSEPQPSGTGLGTTSLIKSQLDDKKWQESEKAKEQSLPKSDFTLLDDKTNTVSTEAGAIAETEEMTSDTDSFATAPKKEVLEDRKNENIEIIWQNILSELQRRHLPTFSLVSTHAFPIDINADTLNIGVFVENFQKMIESKVEYIKTAAVACKLNDNIHVRVRVESNARKMPTTDVNKVKIDISENSGEKPSLLSTKVEKNGPSQSSAARLSANSNREEQSGQSAIKEAYRLFEGPGSRYITPS